MPSHPDVYGLAQVASGWTGAVAIYAPDHYPYTSTVYAVPRESAASLMIRACSEFSRQLGVHFRAWPNADGKITITNDEGSTFAFSATGVTSTRLGVTTTGLSASHTFTSAHFGGTYPSIGIRLEGSTAAQDLGRVVADGSSGTVPLLQEGTTQLRIWGTHSELWSLEPLLGGNTYDVWGGPGRFFGRVRVKGVKRTRLGLLSHQVMLTAECQGVA